MRFFRIILNTVQGNGRKFKFFLLGSLYFTQMLPMAFFFAGLPLIMREGGMSLKTIGYLGFIGVPYASKFLWAPYIDRGAGNANHYKRIVFIMTICYTVMAVIASQINPISNLPLLLVVLGIALTFLATQDIAVDAIATRILSPEERGMGNGLQAAGAFSGYLIAGVMLMLYDRIGWANSVLFLSALLMLSVIPLFFFYEPANPIKSRASFKDIFNFFGQKRILASLLIAVFSGVPLETAYHKMKPLLVDAGFTKDMIALNINIIGMLAGLVASLLFGYIMKKTSIKIGFMLSLVFILLAFPFLLTTAFYFQETQIASALGFKELVIAFGKPLVLFSVILGGAASGGIHATVYALYMNNGREGKEGTDFTVQNALGFLATRLPAPLFGYFADVNGYVGLFSAALVCHLLIVLVAPFIIRKRKKAAVSEKTEASSLVMELVEAEGTSA